MGYRFTGRRILILVCQAITGLNWLGLSASLIDIGAVAMRRLRGSTQLFRKFATANSDVSFTINSLARSNLNVKRCRISRNGLESSASRRTHPRWTPRQGPLETLPRILLRMPPHEERCFLMALSSSMIRKTASSSTSASSNGIRGIVHSSGLYG